ncbi:L-seryl-tRNA(Sec) selenium transferase [Ottowia testudinis]|uniref:L-seryl-tRNA(Sec) selenium transferase n=1 Tax=Ottowia testudinis TaxID=2816950 RepID=A0A975H401_9BURK|nr:L-seryl-tRNA(Sec) selenium transferase [Ottowia testudinis]QTD46398.1 L-seryl-tRNA(Sec) selenium transferase [Ottowia testudinis]
MARPQESVVHGSKAQTQQPSTFTDALAQPQQLPALDRLLRLPGVAALVTQHGHTVVADTARTLLSELRSAAVGHQLAQSAIESEALTAALHTRVQARLAPRMRPVLNLTGTVIHTNLGRALLADAALQHVQAMMAGPNNLEYDLATGARGDRDSIVEGLLCELTGAEAATVVNNNAAAVLLTIAALARGRQVIVSRGELVEIGGAFRMPDVMESAGATLVEVGTTNRTHPHDYERAITDQTALLMKVHTSNYAVQGFTSAVDEAALSSIARKHGLPLATDLGSGALIDMAAHGLPREPTPQQMLKAGCDVVTFSGDKLLGGPQAGLIVGTREAIGRIRTFPMKRALRMSKLPLAALEATLMLYQRPERLAQDLPTLRLLTRPLAAIEATARAVLPALQAALAPRYTAECVALQGQIGSGSLPVERLPSAGLAIAPVEKKGSGRALDALAAALRALPLPVIGRIADDRLILDCRCLEDDTQLTTQIPHLSLSPLAGQPSKKEHP